MFENLLLKAKSVSSTLVGFATGTTHKYLKGDLFLAPEDPTETLNMLRNTGGYRVTRPAYVAIENNSAFVVPSLKEALSGDLAARKFYESTRYIQYAALPDWAQSVIAKIVKSAFAEFRPDMHVSSAEKNLKSLLKAQAKEEKEAGGRDRVFNVDLPTVLGLNAFTTYARFEKFLNLAQPLYFRESLQWDSRTTYQQELLYFSVGNSGPLGKRALTTLQRVVPLMLKTQIVVDYAGTLDVRLPPSIIESVITDTASPWDVLKRGRGLNLVTALDFIASLSLPVPEEKLIEHLPNILKARNVLEELKKTFRSPVTAEDPDLARRIVEKNEMNLRILGFYQALQMHHPKVQEPMKVSDRLARIQRRASTSYESMVTALREGKDPFDLLEEIYLRYLRKKPDDFIGKGKQTATEQARDDMKGAAGSEAELSLPKVMITPLAIERASSFGKEALQALNSRVYRIAMGNFGKAERIAGGFTEVKINTGPGYRLYLTRKGDTWYVEMFGTKGTQDEDINYLRKHVREKK